MSYPVEVEVVLERNARTFEVHRRVRLPGRPGLMSYEQCNRDATDTFLEIPDLTEIKTKEELCGICFDLSELIEE
ncbi:MAG TPA: hypothetical protein VFX15_02955 [Actinomycetes bacterium]|nr:hypothetical protein [Actinomycetes bacterium]